MLIKQGKTNWRYLLIVVVLAAVAGGGILAWQYLASKEETRIPEEKEEVKAPEEKVEEEYFFRLLSPKGGEEWIIGETYKIKWESRWFPEGSIKGVSISLADPANDYSIATVYNPSGEYAWKIPEDLPPGSHYSICIVAIMPYEILETLASPPDDWSDLFTISEETADRRTYQNKEYGFEMKYPEDWDYTILEIPNNPIMFAPENIIAKTEESLQNVESDKDFTLWITVYDKRLFEGGILPYRGKSTEYIQVTSSDVNVGGVKGAYYISKYLKDKGSYKSGEKTATVDLALDGSYLSIHLFNYQYLDIFEKMLSTLKFLK